MNVNERIQALRALMKEKNITAVYIPTSDFHNSEYVGDYFKCRAYMTNFYGSAGVVLITQEKALLWTDARYFIIAANAIKDNEVILMKMAEEGVPTIEEYMCEHLHANDTLAFDGRVVSATLYKQWKELLPEVNFKSDEDLVGQIWTDRPELSNAPAWLLSEKYTGKSTAQKISEIREKMKEYGADYHLISTLDDNAWLFNMRGDDVHSSPVVLSYSIIGMDEVRLFVNENKLSDELKDYLKQSGVVCYPYNDVYEHLTQLPKDKTMLMNSAVVNSLLLSSCACKIVDAPAPSTLMKAMKNEVEIENTRQAHLVDGAAVTKFMIWLKDEIKKREISELEAAEVLYNYRSECEDLIELSFDTIAGYGPNGASMHYTASPESYAMCKAEGFLLVDSGGTYKQGTTDITRTFVLGPLNETFRSHFTTVLRSLIDLSLAHFPYGATGANLDSISRQVFWEKGLDFKHGTGHGVGHVLNVHEGPNNIFWRISPNRPSIVMEEGMITSNEPGYYEEGSHGIRLENEILTVKAEKTEYGQFMKFETLTLAPLDLDGVNVDELTQYEKAWLNDYHKTVYEKLSPFLNEHEKQMLAIYTRAI